MIMDFKIKNFRKTYKIIGVAYCKHIPDYSRYFTEGQYYPIIQTGSKSRKKILNKFMDAHNYYSILSWVDWKDYRRWCTSCEFDIYEVIMSDGMKNVVFGEMDYVVNLL